MDSEFKEYIGLEKWYDIFTSNDKERLQEEIEDRQMQKCGLVRFVPSSSNSPNLIKLIKKYMDSNPDQIDWKKLINQIAEWRLKYNVEAPLLIN